MKYLIKQQGRTCQLWLGNDLIKTAGRCEIKRLATKLHLNNGIQVFNVKASGNIVRWFPNVKTATTAESADQLPK